jgi:thiamine-phosphate pyrophosphorylase
LYAIADAEVIGSKQIAERVTNAIKGGAALIQYRNKSGSEVQRKQDAQILLSLCQSHNVPFIINDDVGLAHSLGCDGVHLGEDDMLVRKAREILGAGSIIGVSCYDSFQNALRAQQSGADYVAFGRFFPSKTKPNAIPAQIELLYSAKPRIHVPVVAIGGITHENARTLINAGADMLAIVGGLFNQENIEVAAQHYARLFRGAK